ncbi:MAG: flagellar basal body L-ring protein FlgH [Rhodothermales bacterium]
MRYLILLACLIFSMPAQAQLSVFADPKAARPGDLLTVVLVERTTAQRESNWANESDGSLAGGAEVEGGSLSGSFAVDAQLNKQARNQNSSSQRDLLSGTITARVIEVDQAGNLVVAGERKLNVNGESHLLRISGVVRPIDVRANNTVLSPDIADANIEYRRGGLHRKFFKPALLTRIGVVAVIVAAIVVGSK